MNCKVITKRCHFSIFFVNFWKNGLFSFADKDFILLLGHLLCGLVLEIDPFHPIANSSEDFVWDGAERVGQDGDGKVVTEYFHGVTLLAVDASDIDHGHVHADVSHIRGFLSIYEAVALTPSQSPVEAVGISDGNSSDDAVFSKDSFPAVTHSLLFWHVPHLQDGGFERADIVENFVVPAGDAIQSQSEAAHVELPFREMLYAGTIVNVPDDFVRECLLQFVACFNEALVLEEREVVEVVAIGTHEV